MSDLITAAQQAFEALAPLANAHTPIERECLNDEDSERAMEALVALEVALAKHKSDFKLKDKMTESNTIYFNCKKDKGLKEMLRLDKDGFHYNGQVIKDAGEAYNLFRQWLAISERAHGIGCDK